MATSYTSMLALPLLILAASQGCSGDSDHRQDVLIEMMRAITHSLDFFNHTTQEELRLQRQNTAALTDLHSLQSLPDMVLKLTEQIIQLSGNINSMKENVAALLLVETLTQENKNLKEQIGSKDHMVNQLTEVNAEPKNDTAYNDKQVQNLEGRLLESEQQVHHLENIVQKLNSTEETLKRTTDRSQECTQPNLHEIKKPVQEFIRNRNWRQLRSHLLPLLDHYSTAYDYVQHTFDYPIYWIGFGNHIELASLLLCAGLPVDTLDTDGYTMFHGASRRGHLQLAEMLLDHSADVNVRDDNGETPLMKAAHYNQPEMVKMLLEHSADVNVRNGIGDTPLMKAAVFNQLEVVKMLVQGGADLTVRNSKGLTALGIASESGASETEAYLKRLLH